MSFFFFYKFDYAEDSVEYYQEHQFPTDLASLDVRPIDDKVTLNETPELKGQFYFGRPEWVNFGRDVSGVNKKTGKSISKEEFNVRFFTECLFIHTLVNRVLEVHYPKQFKKYKFKSFPRFGWFNFGYSDERLPYLLDVPVKQGLPFMESKYIKELIKLFKNIVLVYVTKIGIDKDDFIAKVCEDFEVKQDKFLQYKSYKFSEESAFVKFVNSLKRQIKHASEPKKEKE